MEILRTEGVSKDKALGKERMSHQQALNQRDGLRQEMNKLLSEYRQKQAVVEQQIQEIDKLNLVINNLEQQMLNLKSRYEKCVEERNTTGVQLIDHNDELCILYERSNQQQDYLRSGELELRKKDDEARLLRLQIEELRRQYAAAAKRLPEIAKNRQVITELEQQLVTEQRRTDELSAQLEDPANVDRWRPLDGTDPDMDQLQAKVKVLEDRLDEKREQLLEKELILEEVSTLTERLRSQALQRRESAKSLADQLTELQGRIKDITKKMLATVSELSMYQARPHSARSFVLLLNFVFTIVVAVRRRLRFVCSKKKSLERSCSRRPSGRSLTERRLQRTQSRTGTAWSASVSWLRRRRWDMATNCASRTRGTLPRPPRSQGPRLIFRTKWAFQSLTVAQRHSSRVNWEAQCDTSKFLIQKR